MEMLCNVTNSTAYIRRNSISEKLGQVTASKKSKVSLDLASQCSGCLSPKKLNQAETYRPQARGLSQEVGLG